MCVCAHWRVVLERVVEEVMFHVCVYTLESIASETGGGGHVPCVCAH